jgi:hypothetical protein
MKNIFREAVMADKFIWVYKLTILSTLNEQGPLAHQMCLMWHTSDVDKKHHETWFWDISRINTS